MDPFSNADLWNHFDKMFQQTTTTQPSPREEIEEERIHDTHPKQTLLKSICQYCQSEDLCINMGILCCKDCGAFLEQEISSDAEWRYYGADDSKSTNPIRCGMSTNALLPKSSLGSVIGYLYGKRRFEFDKWRKYHQWNACLLYTSPSPRD